ncbi:MAG TPA: UV DNA damage repair endonuclease UvsE [Ktedonobacteraceae bacterium]|nr:UV DNA damage repair endonuclease UvsE [Ktedonobacteraceae bacterium]
MIRLGYACVNRTLGCTTRSLRLATLRAQGVSYWQRLVDENMDVLARILRWNREQHILVFRISSDLIPLGSHAEADLTRLTFARAQEIAELAQGMRLSMHPGQYTLPSASGRIWENSRRDLAYHAFLLERLGQARGDLILHGGGVYDNRAASAGRIGANISSLPEHIRRYLRLENDERCWSVRDLLPICEATGTPLVVDNLHHRLNGEEPLSELPWSRILATWRGQRPKLHYAEQDLSKRPGAHSEYLSAADFRAFRRQVPLEDYDVMLECKAKDLALLRLRADLAELEQAGASASADFPLS